MGEKLNAFGKGGCGCLIAFVVLAIIGIATGARVHADIGGIICLFVIGGLIGLAALWLYNKGKKDGADPNP